MRKLNKPDILRQYAKYAEQMAAAAVPNAHHAEDLVPVAAFAVKDGDAHLRLNVPHPQRLILCTGPSSTVVTPCSLPAGLQISCWQAQSA